MVTNENFNIHCIKFVSIISVISYHYFLNKYPLFGNGYLGVDIFFIISGFLITKSIAQHNYNYKNFLIRRFLRIFPSLIIVTLLFSFFFYVFLFDEDLIKILKSNYFNFTATSNFFYYNKKIEYGSPDSSTIPFLHTWSLSIEVQFYLLIAILFTFKYFRNPKFILILLIFLYLLFISANDENKKFFLTHLRLYEFFIGVFLVFVTPFKIKYILNICYILIVIILLYPETFLYNKEIIIFLTSCVLIANSNLFVYYINFINKIIIYISNISYSLYLIHNPIVYYLLYIHVKFEFLTAISYVNFICASLFLSILNYHFIEKLFWKKSK